MLAMDLNRDESEEELLNQICKEAGVDCNDVVLAWASPPCESHSRANWSNLSWGFNHRKLEKGFPPADIEKGKIAEQHDRLVQRVKVLLELVGRYVMENPKGGLEKMEFMKDWKNRKMVVDLCSFIWPFKKTTNLLVGNFKWKPAVTTGDGRCGEQCGQGAADILTKAVQALHGAGSLHSRPTERPKGCRRHSHDMWNTQCTDQGGASGSGAVCKLEGEGGTGPILKVPVNTQGSGGGRSYIRWSTKMSWPWGTTKRSHTRQGGQQ